MRTLKTKCSWRLKGQSTHHIPQSIFWSFLFGENDKPNSFSYYLPSGLSPTNKNYPTRETELLFCHGCRMEHYWKNPKLKMCIIAGEGESGMNWESSIETYTLTCVKQTVNGKLLYNTGSSNPVLCDNLEGWMGWGVGGTFKKEGAHVDLWPIHVVVWEKPTHHCNAIILQIKIN